jgi:membrane protease YdiL (CAAX protease family)
MVIFTAPFAVSILNAENQYDVSSMFASPWRSLALGFFLLLLCIMFSAVTGQWLMNTFAAEGTTFDDLPATQPGLYRFLQGLSNILSWGLAATFWAIYTGGFSKRLGLGKHTWPGFFPLAALTIVVALPFVEWLLIDQSSFKMPGGLEGFEDWARERETSMGGTIVSLLSDTSPTIFFANVVVFAVIPAVSEELFFRGFLVGTLKRVTGLHAAVWISAIIFSLLHFQFLGFFSRVILGALMGYFYVYSGSLWASIIAHFMHNLVNIVIAVLAIRGVLPGEIIAGSFDFGFLGIIASLVLTIALLYYFARRAHRHQSTLQYE